mmetsp:Transcript_45485/g.110730  ORF Transcript_45485/g.110730 Transcript_45485/m.110730 type:complete len:275 (-) Transcript_45485:842-1666(-)
MLRWNMLNFSSDTIGSVGWLRVPPGETTACAPPSLAAAITWGGAAETGGAAATGGGAVCGVSMPSFRCVEPGVLTFRVRCTVETRALSASMFGRMVRITGVPGGPAMSCSISAADLPDTGVPFTVKILLDGLSFLHSSAGEPGRMSITATLSCLSIPNLIPMPPRGPPAMAVGGVSAAGEIGREACSGDAACLAIVDMGSVGAGAAVGMLSIVGLVSEEGMDREALGGGAADVEPLRRSRLTVVPGSPMIIFLTASEGSPCTNMSLTATMTSPG